MTAQINGRNLAAEFVATTVVMLGGPGLWLLGGPDIGRLEVALGFGIATAIAIGVIGGVANPMFSLALWFARGITGRELVGDLIGQFTGAIFGAAIIYGLNDLDRFTSATNGWQPSDSIDPGVDVGLHLTGFAGMGVVIAAELVIGLLMVVVLLATVRNERSTAAGAAFVGAAMTLSALFLFPISGVGINPARSLATAIFADTDPNALGQVWLFILLPVVTAFGGLLVWLAIDEATIDDTVFDDTLVESTTDIVTGDG